MIFADVVAIWLNVTLSALRSILNPVSLFALSLHDRLISRHPAAVADRFEGAAGVGGVRVAVGVGVGGAVAVGVELGLGVGVGLEAVTLIRRIFATDGTPLE